MGRHRSAAPAAKSRPLTFAFDPGAAPGAEGLRDGQCRPALAARLRSRQRRWLYDSRGGSWRRRGRCSHSRARQRCGLERRRLSQPRRLAGQPGQFAPVRNILLRAVSLGVEPVERGVKIVQPIT